MGVVVSVGWGGVDESAGVLVGSADGEEVSEGVATGCGVPQAEVTRVSTNKRMRSFFIGWIFGIAYKISNLPSSGCDEGHRIQN